MIKNSARKLTFVFTLAALMAPIGHAVAQSVHAKPSATSGTDPEPTIVKAILTFLGLA